MTVRRIFDYTLRQSFLYHAAADAFAQGYTQDRASRMMEDTCLTIHRYLWMSLLEGGFPLGPLGGQLAHTYWYTDRLLA